MLLIHDRGDSRRGRFGLGFQVLMKTHLTYNGVHVNNEAPAFIVPASNFGVCACARARARGRIHKYVQDLY
jgi:hypothetical protein